MVEKKFNVKKWVAAILFGAIIIVFALFGVRPDKYGDAAGGVAATVNDNAISIAEPGHRRCPAPAVPRR